MKIMKLKVGDANIAFALATLVVINASKALVPLRPLLT
jgi:hypothetical protein